MAGRPRHTATASFSLTMDRLALPNWGPVGEEGESEKKKIAVLMPQAYYRRRPGAGEIGGEFSLPRFRLRKATKREGGKERKEERKGGQGRATGPHGGGWSLQPAHEASARNPGSSFSAPGMAARRRALPRADIFQWVGERPGSREETQEKGATGGKGEGVKGGKKGGGGE